MSTENNQEAAHWANIEAQGQRKTVLGRRDNSESWKAVKSYWDGSFKDNGKSGCGVVIGVDKNKWVTISKIVFPLKAGTAMASEVGGVCVFMGFVDLIFCKCLCAHSVNQCINRIFNKQ